MAPQARNRIMKLNPQLLVVVPSDEDDSPGGERPNVRGPIILHFPTPLSGRIYWEMRRHYLEEYGRTVH